MRERREGDVLVVTWEGDALDAYAAPDLRTLVGSRIDEGWTRVVLDLTEVRFLDSTGLGALVHLHKRAGASGRLVICGAGDLVMDVLRLTRMDRALLLAPSADAAVARCRAAA
jgi:anti-sigma B factor antagonist